MSFAWPDLGLRRATFQTRDLVEHAVEEARARLPVDVNARAERRVLDAGGLRA